jgi:hypothetical protein
MLLKKSPKYIFTSLVVKVTESSATVIKVVTQKLEGSKTKPILGIRTRCQLNAKNGLCNTADLIL